MNKTQEKDNEEFIKLKESYESIIILFVFSFVLPRDISELIKLYILSVNIGSLYLLIDLPSPYHHFCDDPQTNRSALFKGKTLLFNAI